MKKLSIEVKTHYAVELTLSEMWSLYCRYECTPEGDTKRLFYPKAYDTLHGLSTIGDFEKALDNSILHSPHGETYDYMAKELGFYGWDNAGLWDKDRLVYRFYPYNKGADI